jgi:putative ABC transport system permease protein
VVLLICCANVSNLLLGQSLARKREMAIRAALGSGRSRLLRQLLTESLMLGVSAASVGLVLAAAAVHYFRAANPIDLPPATVVRVDAGILAFTVVLSIITTVAFGLAPAWKASRTDLNTALKTGGRSSSQDAGAQRFGHSLIVAEIALTVILLAGAGLLIQSVNKFASAPLGFQPEGLVTANIRLPREDYAKPEQRVRRYNRLLDELRNTRGVEGEALSTSTPATGPGAVSVLAVEGQPDPEPGRIPDAAAQTVSQDYFQVMKIALKRGRFFDERDRQDGEPVTIINEALAAGYFPKDDPIGRHVRAFDGPGRTNPWLRIIGVVGNERRSAVTAEMSWDDAPVTYIPWSQNAPISGVLILGTRAEGAAAARLIQRASGDPDIAVGDLDTVPHAMARILAYPRFRAGLLAGFAGLALLLAVVGLYGVLSRLVTRRTHEIGIRMALGAKRVDVLAMVASDGMLLTAIGLALGLVAVWGLTRLLKALLYGVSATDPATLVLVTMAILCSTALAAFVPVRRATHVDPMIALRDE